MDEGRVRSVNALLSLPDNARCLFVFAHGAGAGMAHPFMDRAAQELTARRVASLRYSFPYMESERRRPPDRAPVLEATVRAAVSAARELAPDLPLLAGGKSMGGRMTSRAASQGGLPGIAGLVFYGFPLHPPGRPSTERAEHLGVVDLPMLFLQGTRDKLADLQLLSGVLDPLPSATLHRVDGADHGFHVLKKSLRTEADVHEELADTVVAWAAVLGLLRCTHSLPEFPHVS